MEEGVESMRGGEVMYGCLILGKSQRCVEEAKAEILAFLDIT